MERYTFFVNEMPEMPVKMSFLHPPHHLKSCVFRFEPENIHFAHNYIETIQPIHR